MNWQTFTDSTVGDKDNFTNSEVRDIVRKTLEYVTDCWVKKTR